MKTHWSTSDNWCATRIELFTAADGLKTVFGIETSMDNVSLTVHLTQQEMRTLANELLRLAES